MVQVEYDDTRYGFETKVEAVLFLRSKGYKAAEIAKVLGVARSGISMLLANLGYSGHVAHPELDDPEILMLDEDDVSKQFRVKKYRIRQARKRLNLNKMSRIDMAKRRQHLAEFLFEREPGPNFVNFVNTILFSQMPPKQAELISQFYMTATKDQNVNTRVYRLHAKVALKKIVSQYDVKELIAQKVLSSAG
jgi:hypothetical protein